MAATYSSGSVFARLRRRVVVTATEIALLGFVVIGGMMPAVAEDEDTSASVYLVFDPETGEFVTSDDPSKALPHQTGLESSSAAPLLDSPAARIANDTTAGGGKFLLPASIVVLLAGVAFYLRRSRQKAA